jgi:GNAT superfamily N-acetyltransferase
MDMLVPLYRLPESGAALCGALRTKHDVLIRHVYPFERSALRDFIQQHFSRAWGDEAEMGFRHMPASVLLAIHNRQIVGFAAYDCTFNGFFGPTGVDPAYRGRGIGKALLLASLEELRHLGYVYGVIGSVGPAEFYVKNVNATPIADSTPGPYADLLKDI